jgi:hypothetical protein
VTRLFKVPGLRRPKVLLDHAEVLNAKKLSPDYEETSLDEPWPLPPEASRWAARFLCRLGGFLWFVVLFRAVSYLPFWWAVGALLGVALLLLYLAYRRFVAGYPQVIHLPVALATAGAVPLLTLESLSEDPLLAYAFLFTPAVALASVLSHLVTTQYVFRLAASPWVVPEVKGRWEGYWRHVFRVKLSDQSPPAVREYPRGFGAVLSGWVAGFLALASMPDAVPALFAGPVGLLSFLLGTLVSSVFVWNQEAWRRPRELLQESWASTVHFLCYNPPPAPGFFRLPTRGLRPLRNRLMILGLGVFLLAGGIVSGCADSPSGPPGSPPRAERNGAFGAFVATRLVPAVSLLLSLPWAIAGPFVVLAAIHVTAGGRVLLCYREALGARGPAATPRPWFKNRVLRVLYGSEREREHLLVGVTVHTGIPVYLHRDVFHLHMVSRGGTGSGKTSIGFMFLLLQLMLARSPERLAWLRARGEGPPDPASFVIFDLGGDRAAMELARRTAQASGLRWKLFSFEKGHASHVFNPVLQSHVPDMSVSQLAQEWLQALGLEYGDKYGAAFFASVMEVALLGSLSEELGVESFSDLDKVLSDPAFFSRICREKDFENARHLAAVARRLSVIEPLNVSTKDLKDRPELETALRAQIDFREVLRVPTCVYFWLPTTRGRTVAASIAKLGAFAALSAAASRGPEEKNRLYVFCDEAQELVSRNMSVFLTQARKFGLTCVLAHQSVEQLKDAGADLRNVVSSNTGAELLFKFSDSESKKYVEEHSPESLYASLSWGQDATLVSDPMEDGAFSIAEAAYQAGGLLAPGPVPAGVAERVEKLYSKLELSEFSADPGIAMFRATQEKGFTLFRDQFVPVAVEHVISDNEYRKFRNEPWPTPTPETIAVKVDSRKAHPPDPVGPGSPLPAESKKRTAPARPHSALGADAAEDPLKHAIEERMQRWEEELTGDQEEEA